MSEIEGCGKLVDSAGCPGQALVVPKLRNFLHYVYPLNKTPLIVTSFTLLRLIPLLMHCKLKPSTNHEVLSCCMYDFLPDGLQ